MENAPNLTVRMPKAAPSSRTVEFTRLKKLEKLHKMNWTCVIRKRGCCIISSYFYTVRHWWYKRHTETELDQWSTPADQTQIIYKVICVCVCVDTREECCWIHLSHETSGTQRWMPSVSCLSALEIKSARVLLTAEPLNRIWDVKAAGNSFPACLLYASARLQNEAE